MYLANWVDSRAASMHSNYSNRLADYCVEFGKEIASRVLRMLIMERAFSLLRDSCFGLGVMYLEVEKGQTVDSIGTQEQWPRKIIKKNNHIFKTA